MRNRKCMSTVLQIRYRNRCNLVGRDLSCRSLCYTICLVGHYVALDASKSQLVVRNKQWPHFHRPTFKRFEMAPLGGRRTDDCAIVVELDDATSADLFDEDDNTDILGLRGTRMETLIEEVKATGPVSGKDFEVKMVDIATRSTELAKDVAQTPAAVDDDALLQMLKEGSQKGVAAGSALAQKIMRSLTPEQKLEYDSLGSGVRNKKK